MSKKQIWMKLDEVPEEARPLLMAFHQLFGLHHTNNVVRSVIGGDNPAVIIQTYGRKTAGQLRALEESAECRVEVEARAPNYLLIMLFGYAPVSLFPICAYTDDQELSFLFKEMN